jgi:hypothetical protein
MKRSDWVFIFLAVAVVLVSALDMQAVYSSGKNAPAAMIVTEREYLDMQSAGTKVRVPVGIIIEPPAGAVKDKPGRR